MFPKISWNWMTIFLWWRKYSFMFDLILYRLIDLVIRCQCRKMNCRRQLFVFRLIQLQSFLGERTAEDMSYRKIFFFGITDRKFLKFWLFALAQCKVNVKCFLSLWNIAEDWFMIIRNLNEVIRANIVVFVYCQWLYDADFVTICTTEFLFTSSESSVFIKVNIQFSFLFHLE